MSYLDDYINNATKLRIKRTPTCIPKLLAVIRANKFDPENPNHAKWKNVGLKYGYIDPEMHILKGE